MNTTYKPTGTSEAEGYAALPISPRLEEIAVQVSRGQAPNAGRFCGNCYTPLAAERERCPYCGTAAAERPPQDHIPPAVFEIVRAKRGRESLIVNGLAYLGLGIGTAVAILMVLALPGVWKAAALVVLLLGTRGLAAVLGGWFGDSLGYRSASALVRRRWGQFVRDRDAGPSDSQ